MGVMVVVKFGCQYLLGVEEGGDEEETVLWAEIIFWIPDPKFEFEDQFEDE